MNFYIFRKSISNSARIYSWKLLGAEIDEDVIISSGVSMRFPSKVTVGKGTKLSGKCILIDSWGKVDIGRNVLMNDNISLFSAGHPVNSPDFSDGTKFIKIGDYVWLPHHIIVLPGVTIGDFAVIGTGSVVSRDVPDYGIAVGNPAKVVKQRAKIEYNYIPSHF